MEQLKLFLFIVGILFNSIQIYTIHYVSHLPTKSLSSLSLNIFVNLAPEKNSQMETEPLYIQTSNETYILEIILRSAQATANYSTELNDTSVNNKTIEIPPPEFTTTESPGETTFLPEIIGNTEPEIDRVSLTVDEELILLNGKDIDYNFNDTIPYGADNRTLISAPGCPL